MNETEIFLLVMFVIITACAVVVCGRLANGLADMEVEYERWRLDRLRRYPDSPYLDLSRDRFLLERKLRSRL